MLSLKMIISSEIMEFILRPIFNVLTVPDLKIKKPSWIAMPSPWTIFAFILLSYFLVTGGIIYDVIVEPPSVGSTTDEHGHQRPVAFMPYRVNGEKKSESPGLDIYCVTFLRSVHHGGPSQQLYV